MRKGNARRNRSLPRRQRASVGRLELRVLLSTIVVNTTRDDGPFPVSSGLVSLRDAVALANSSATPSTIVFNPNVFGVPRKITLDRSPLDLSNTRHSITISGPAAALTVQDPEGDGAFLIDQDANAVIEGLNVGNCFDTTITNNGTLTFVNGSISDGNQYVGLSGGLDNFGTAILSNDTVTRNSGGAIHNAGSLRVTGSTFFDNQGGLDAIDNDGTALLIDDTLSDNKADAELYNIGSLSLVNVTVSNNAVAESAIVNNRNGSSTATVTLANSIVAGNLLDDFVDATNPDIEGIVHSLGHNLIGQADGVGGLVSSDLSGTTAHPLDPRLAPLANYGGATDTMVPVGGSPALGGGSIALLPAGTTTDQRGQPRITRGMLDIGAAQISGPASVTLTAPRAQSCARFKPTAIELGSIGSLTGMLPITVVVNWGDGSADSIVHVAKLGTLSRLAHSFLGSGTLSVSLSATDSSGVSNLITFAVSVSDAPAVVNSLNFNASSGSGLLGLGDAVALVDQTKTDATISFDPTLFATPRTFKIGDVELSGHHTITIDGPSAGVDLQGTTFDAGLTVDLGVIADVSELTIAGCSNSGVHNDGELHLRNSTISGNATSLRGAGIDNAGSLYLSDVTISGNRDYVEGGAGIFNWSYATATLKDVNIFNNLGGGITNAGVMSLMHVNIEGNSGGGIDNGGQLTLTNGNISKNTSDYGGGIYNSGNAVFTDVSLSQNHSTTLGGGAVNYGTLNLTNCTIADNIADGTNFDGTHIGAGGGLLNDGTVIFNNVTVAGNRAYPLGAGIANDTAGEDNSGMPFTISNSIVADNILTMPNGADLDAIGKFKSLGHNLIGSTDGSFGWTKSDLLGTSAHPLDPKLAPFAYYGQFTATMPPLPGSPAVDRGANNLVPAGITTDQRGLPRISHGTVDIGAVELQQPQIVGLFLVHARTGQTIMPLINGATINLSAIPQQFDVVAMLKDGVPGSVVFGLDGISRFRIEKAAPFSLFGDVGGRLLAGTFAAGKHTITERACIDSAASQPVGNPLTIQFTVIEGIKSYV